MRCTVLVLVSSLLSPQAFDSFNKMGGLQPLAEEQEEEELKILEHMNF